MLPDGIFELKELPQDLLIIGTESIGLELGQGLARLGSKVTIIETNQDILNLMDHDCVLYLEN